MLWKLLLSVYVGLVLYSLSVFLDDKRCPPSPASVPDRCYIAGVNLTAESVVLQVFATTDPGVYESTPSRGSPHEVHMPSLRALLKSPALEGWHHIYSTPIATLSLPSLSRVLGLGSERGTETEGDQENGADIRVRFQVPLQQHFPTVRKNGTLTARLLLVRATDGLPQTEDRSDEAATFKMRDVLAWTDVRLTSYKEEARGARMLLSGPESSGQNASCADCTQGGPVTSHWKYSSRRTSVTFRIVVDEADHAVRRLPDGTLLRTAALQQQIATQQGSSEKIVRHVHLPLAYVDEVTYLQHFPIPLSSNSDHQDPEVIIEVKATSMLRHRISRQASASLDYVGALMSDAELDELRYLLSDKHLFRFFLTQAIGIAHMILDFLAFRNDIGFYAGKEAFVGLSMGSVGASLVCSTVMFLYLADSPHTSYMVLFSVFLGLATSVWKFAKIYLSRRRVYRQSGGDAERHAGNTEDQELATVVYDRIATRNLAFVMVPAICGVALHSLVHQAHRSWYSWIIGAGASAVYFFGFLRMLPQLYINYRLKSVAHLPWRVFMYKAFSTFIDDAFAFIVMMPTAHRIATLRDDVLFLGYLYQAWLYPVDRSRPNEYGIAYESKEHAHDDRDERADPDDQPVRS